MTDTATPRKITMGDLRNSDATFYVRNDSPKTLTCNEGKDIRFILGPKGADDSVQILPPAVALQPGFQRAWLRGDVTISDDPEMQNEILFQAERRSLADIARANEVQAVVEPSSASKSMVERLCLVSGERVFLTEQEVKDLVPPLAERFKDQAHLWIPTEVPGKDGEIETVWKKSEVTTS